MSLEKIKQKRLKRAIERFEKKEACKKGGFSAGAGKFYLKILAALLILNLNWFGLFAIGNTFAYFADQEMAQENSLTAGTLDFHLNSSADFVPSPLNKGDMASYSTALVNDGSLGFQYTASITDMGGDSDLCSYLTLQANLNGALVYDASLSGFSVVAGNYIDPSVWNFVVTLPIGADDTLQDKTCNFKFIFSGWQENLPDSSSGFTATKEIFATLNSGHWTSALSGVVLNEFLPRPSGTQYGHDFGDDNSNMPKGEWVELYNNSNTARDLSGWYVRDSLDSSDHKILIDTAHTGLTTQIIGAKGFLVVFMNKALFNNNSNDSVRLFDTNDVLIDLYSYTLPADFCNLKPTEGDNNDENGSGIGTGCRSEVPTNKSYARIPDGIGAWIDPIPTPGEPNVLGGEETPIELSQLQQEPGPEAIIYEENPVINEQPPVAIINFENTNEAPAGDAPSGTSEPEVIQEQQPAIELEVQIIAEEPEIAAVPSDDVSSSGDTAGDN